MLLGGTPAKIFAVGAVQKCGKQCCVEACRVASTVGDVGQKRVITRCRGLGSEP